MKKHNNKKTFILFIVVLLGLVMIVNQVFLPLVAFAENDTETMKVQLGIAALEETTDEQQGSTLYFGSEKETSYGWKVLNKKNNNEDGTVGMTLSLEANYNNLEDDGQSFFESVLDEQEKTGVLEVQASPSDENGKWIFGLMLDITKIAYTMPSDEQYNSLKKVEKTLDNDFKLALQVNEEKVEASTTQNLVFYSNTYHQTLNITHASANSVFSEADRLSAMIIDKNNHILYYGKVNEANAVESVVAIPDELDAGKYSLAIFAEKDNGHHKTNYVSASSVINFTIIEPIEKQQSEVNEIPCDDEYCSHVYRGLDEQLYPICEYGENMIAGQNISLLSMRSAKATPSITNLALHKPVIARWTSDNSHAERTDKNPMSNAVDGIDDDYNNHAEFGYPTKTNASSYMQIDLEKISVITSLQLYRYWADGRTYNATVIAVSNTEDFTQSTVVYNSDANNLHGFGTQYAIGKDEYDSTYSETSSGFTLDLIDHNIQARYVRVYMSGSAGHNSYNHIIELKVNGYVEDPYYNQGIYFVSMPDLYKTNGHFQAVPLIDEFDNIKVESVFAKFENSEGSTKTYRMIELQEGVFSTVIPKKLEGESIFSQLSFEIHYSDSNGEHVKKYEIEYDFTASGDIEDHITDSETNQGEFSFAPTIRDCFYWYNYPTLSYWSGHPSSGLKILDEQSIYVDMSSSLDQSKRIKGWENGAYLSYFDESINKVVSVPITKHTREDNIRYYLFEKNCGLTEHTLLAISNLPLNEDGTYNADIPLQIVYITYNVASQDNFLVLRKGSTKERIWETYEASGDRYVSFRDQLYGESGALIAGNEDESGATDTIQYRLPSGFDDSSNGEWITMKQNTDSTNNADLYKLFTTPEMIAYDNEYIQFRILNGSDVNQIKYTSDILEIDDTYAFPCFFADVYQKSSTSYQSKNGGISGVWTSLFKGNYHGDDSRDIPQGTNSSYNSEYYYATCTFYDYYSDYEIEGNKLETATGDRLSQGGTTYKYSNSASIFNNAISKYFENKDNPLVYPFYFGADRVPVSNTISLYGQTTANGWEKGFHYFNGCVDSQLDTNGNLTTQGIIYPQYDESFLRGDNALNTALAYVYNDVDFPFILNEDGYWEFDSGQSQYAVRLKEDSKKGYYLGFTDTPIHDGGNASFASTAPGFFPFADADDNRNDSRLNGLMGVKMELEFSITETGTIKVENPNTDQYSEQPISFEFSGDDDFILFIDDRLALDLTGCHDPIHGKIDFSNGEVMTNKVNEDLSISTDEGDCQAQTNIYDPTQGITSLAELSTGKHTMTIYYAERGLYCSNLKIAFNFPRNNQLDITNQVDTSAANEDVFGSVLANIGGFKYEIKTQATNGSSLDVTESAGYLQNTGSLVFNDFSDSSQYHGTENQVELNCVEDQTDIIEDKENVLLLSNVKSQNDLNYQEMYDEITSENKYWVTINASEGIVNLSDMEYLRMDAYLQANLSSGSGAALFVRLIDNQGEILQSSANYLVYNSYSNALINNNWSTLRLSLAKLKETDNNFDIAHVKQIQFALARDGGKLYIHNLGFRGSVIESVSTGFQVNNNQISDYQSLIPSDDGTIDYQKGQLHDAFGAWFTLNDIDSVNVEDGNPIMVPENGLFGLASEQKASFTDKFREGSYLQIQQKDPSKEKAFKTTWSILENAVYDSTKGIYTSGYVDDNWLAMYYGNETVYNDGDMLYNTITNVEGNVVSDNRNVVDLHSSEVDYIYPSSNRTQHISGNNNTMVYRSYHDPDNKQKSNLHLTVAFQNELLVGGIIVTKKLADNEVAKHDHTFTFHVHYTDIAGMNLEASLGNSHTSDNLGLVQEVTVKIRAGESEGSTVVYGIPLGTTYTVHEVNEIPQSISAGNIYSYPINNIDKYVQENVNLSDFMNETDDMLHDPKLGKKEYNVGTVNYNYQVVSGTTKESLQQLTFTNLQHYSHGEIEIRKVLSDSVYDIDKSFLFHIHYTESGKEEVVVPITVTVKAGETTASCIYSNIPVDAVYNIHEVDSSALSSVESAQKSVPIENTDQVIGEQYIPHENVNTIHDAIFKCDGREYRMYASGIAKLSRHEFTFTNNGPNMIALQKIDDQGIPLAGVTFTLYNQQNSIIAKSSSIYYRKIIIDEDKDEILKTGQITVEGQSYQVHGTKNNLYYYMPLTQDEINRYLSDDKIDETVVAVAIFTNIPDGQYYIRETNTLNGYEKMSKDISIDYTNKTDNPASIFTYGDGISQEETVVVNDAVLTVINKLKTAPFHFVKVNKEDQSLSGAKFAIFELICENQEHKHTNDMIQYTIKGNGEILSDSECWTYVMSEESDHNGEVTFAGLKVLSEYRLVEIEAPDDYVLPNGQWKITYNKDDNKFEPTGSVNNPPALKGEGTSDNPYVVINYTSAQLPITGGRGWFYFIGAFTIFVAICLWTYQNNQSKNKKISLREEKR